jgi:hypothetical protein
LKNKGDRNKMEKIKERAMFAQAMFIMSMTGIKDGLVAKLKDERGDTNFIAIAVIVAIILVLAGLFLALGESVMGTIKTKVEGFVGKA